MRLHHRPERAAGVEGSSRDAGGEADIPHLKVTVSWITGDVKAAEFRRQVSRACEGACIRHADPGRHVVHAAQFVRHDRAHLRVSDRGALQIARQGVVRPQDVVRHLGGRRADHRELVDDLAALGHRLAEHDARKLRLHDAERPAVFDRCLGLRVPRFLVAARARQKDLDHVPGRRLLCSPARFGAAEREIVAEAEAEGTGGSDLEETSPRGGRGAKALTTAEKMAIRGAHLCCSVAFRGVSRVWRIVLRALGDCFACCNTIWCP